MIKIKQKNYTSAPMPFMGQKRRFVSDFKEALKLFDNSTIFVDLFGGSGLLSYVTKQARPDAQVIYNDFDDYHLRLNNCKRTNELLADIRTMVVDIPKEKKLTDGVKARVLKRIYKDEKTGGVDYITLSSSLLFSANYVSNYNTLEKSTMFNNLKQSDYNCDGYLDGLVVVKEDYKTLFNKYKDRKDVVFFVKCPQKVGRIK